MRGVDIIRIKRPIFVMMFAGVMIFGVALAASTMMGGSEPPIKTNVSTLPATVQEGATIFDRTRLSREYRPREDRQDESSRGY